jgi:hypothetical protein
MASTDRPLRRTRRNATVLAAENTVADATFGNSPWVRWHGHSFAVVAILALVAISYGNSLDAEFQADDQFFAADPSLHPGDLGGASLGKALWHRRPIASLTFALNYYWGQSRVLGYHVVNVAIHAATAVSLYVFLVLISRLPRGRNSVGALPYPVMLVATLLWAVHPVQTQAVTYVVQRMTSLAALFYLLALIAYLKGRQSDGRRRVLWWTGALGSGALALGSKEIAATLPFAVVLVEVCLIDRDWRMVRRIALGALLLVIPVAVAAVFAAQDGAGGSFWAQLTAHRSINQEFTFTQHFLTEGRVILYYVTLLAFPHPSRLTFDYAFPISYDWLAPPSTLVAWLVIFGVIAWAVTRCGRSPIVAFGVLWFFLNLAIESSLIPLDLAYEHRLYLPSMGPALLAALAGSWACRRWPTRGLRYLPFVAGLILVFVWTAWTIERNRVWATELSLWTDTVAKAPANPRALVTLALAQMERGELDRAMDLLQAAIRANPSYHHAYTALAYLHVARNNRAAAIENFQAALLLVPGDTDGHYQVARLLDDAGRLPEAASHYRRFLDLATPEQETARAWAEARVRVISTPELEE